MAMTGSGLKAALESALAGVPSTGNVNTDSAAFREAWCTAFISYVKANAVCTGTDPQGGTVTSTIS